MTLSTFPTFLTFLTFLTHNWHSPASDPRQGLEIAPSLRREHRQPRTAGDDLKPQPPSQGARAPAGASRLAAAMSCSISGTAASQQGDGLGRRTTRRPRDHIGERYGGQRRQDALG